MKAFSCLFGLIFAVSCSKTPDEKKCVGDCLHGGACVQGACVCDGEWSGEICEYYFTDYYSGVYSSSNFNCGSGPFNYSVTVKVDSTDKKLLYIGGMRAKMTDNHNFVIPDKGPSDRQGTGSIDGTNLVLSYSVTFANSSCSGNFSRKK
jgi:hypothetical protein